ncbi:MAG TPA: hypothetical protein PKG52_11465 [bacterium]|nr:hypothetical protein [bacterium]HPS30965.1 hypothetical protein [bacterium]
MLQVQKEFNQFLELLKRNEVEFLIVGSYARAYHGSPSFTGNIDIFVKPSTENAEKIVESLNSFGFGKKGIHEADLSDEGSIVQLGVPPIRIDIMTSITGVSWDEAYNGAVDGMYGDISVKFLGKKQYITNKKAVGRMKDLADIEEIL